ncbi:MAG: chromosome partitioning protein [Gammaproteobacteria bacterium RIFCSPHIGHO2_12_FULL_41_15]|nr:MAG: chromosome partitioning protein [Gammaproteobacteria bacterium RIFCSPHIGHO2_12_FULL_41_15]
MAKGIAITNQKGGVGKTTSTINIASSLAYNKQRVLLIDMDPQGNATMGSGVDKHKVAKSVNDVLMEQCAIDLAIINTKFNYDLLPGNADLTEAEVHLVTREQRAQVLANALNTVKDIYEFILIDCPPSLNTLTLNALVAADSVLIPMQCEYFALEGLADLITTIDQVRQTVNPSLSIEGILRTMYDVRSRLCADVSSQLLDHFAEKIYRTVIPRNVRLAEAPSYGMPAMHYDRHSAGAAAYMVLAAEILNKQTMTME